MDYNRKVTLTAIALIAIVIVSSTVYILVTEPRITADMAAFTAQAQKIFDDAKTQIEQLRNVTVPYQVTLHVITVQQAVDKWGGTSSDQDIITAHRQENIYKGLFMMAESDSLIEAKKEWTANWGAATVGKNDIYVIYENFDPWDMPSAEATFVHEFTHIWEPQLMEPNSFDMDKAHAGLVEGDASFMGDYYKDHYNANPQLSTLKVNGVPVFLLDAPNNVYPMPDTLNNINWFPYTQGKTYIQTLYANGGFQTLNKAYQPEYTPSTTEQILHTDKYFANESNQPVTAPKPTNKDWTPIQINRGTTSERYGEYFIQIMLGNWLKDNNSQQAINAAAGWAGDNFTYYEKGASDFLFSWNIKWDTATDATEFFKAFQDMMTKTSATEQSSLLWTANGRYLTITINQEQNSTIIACSTDQTAIQPANLT